MRDLNKKFDDNLRHNIDSNNPDVSLENSLGGSLEDSLWNSLENSIGFSLNQTAQSA